MTSCGASILPKNISSKSNPFRQIPSKRSANLRSNLPPKPQEMWTSIAKRVASASLRNPSYSGELCPCSLPPIPRFVTFPMVLSSRGKDRIPDHKTLPNCRFSETSQRQNVETFPFLGTFKNSIAKSGFEYNNKGFASVAEAVSSRHVEEEASTTGEIQVILEELSKEEEIARVREIRQKPKYAVLLRGQIKIETEAWEHAAAEYKELLMEMCRLKLAPNLPYMKSLFLGWFEPLRDRIAAQQKLHKEGKTKVSYAPYFSQLPADMMSVITMHKLMGLLMTGGGDGSARVVQAAVQIGEAVEQEVRIHRFLEKTKKMTNKDKRDEGEKTDSLTKEQEMLRKKVINLMKKQKLHQVRKIVKGQDDFKPWDQDAQAKVGSRLIELLVETAYIQPQLISQLMVHLIFGLHFDTHLELYRKRNTKTADAMGLLNVTPLYDKG